MKEVLLNFLGLALLFSSMIPASAGVSGTITGSGGQPVSGARVFLEPGLAGALAHVQAGADGSFRFDAVPSGLIGIFAIADGYGFDGLSRKVPVGDSVTGLTIALRPAGEIAGRVVDMKGDPVSGARITRVGIMGTPPVGIPVAKLAEFGFEDTVTDEEGRFVVSNLPQGATLTLKVAHSQFAQAGVPDVAVGDRNVRVQLSPGVSVRGTVVSRDGNTPVANAGIIIGSASPPHDTAITKTDFSGEFSIRLNPGYYLYQAAGMELRSPGWEKLTVSGREPSQRVTLRVAGTTMISGEVRDAVTGDPIAGARLRLAAFGSPADVVITGPSGTYEFTGVEGENQIRLEVVPGYIPPDRPYLTINDAQQGQPVIVPTFWLRPLPSQRVQVVDEADEPASGVLLRLIRPLQFGVYVTDAAGYAKFDIVSLPEGGAIIGIAEHPVRPLVALFSINPSGTEPARIKLFPAGAVKGTVVNPKGKPVVGAVVGGLFQDEGGNEPVQLWRTVSGKDGTFSWNGVIPFVPMACLAATGPDGFGRSMPFNASPGSVEDVGNVVIADTGGSDRKNQGQTLLGEKLDWSEYPVLSGTPSDVSHPTVLLYATAAEAPLYLQTLSTMQSALGDRGVDFVLVCDGPVSLTGGSIPILQGVAPGSAQTYLLNREGVVVLETWGLPQAATISQAGDGA
jgi:hypothetical protein